MNCILHSEWMKKVYINASQIQVAYWPEFLTPHPVYHDNCISWVSSGLQWPSSPKQGKSLSHWPEMCLAHWSALTLTLTCKLYYVMNEYYQHKVGQLSSQVCMKCNVWPHEQLERLWCVLLVAVTRQCALQMAPVRIQLPSSSLDTGVTRHRETTQCPEHNRERKLCGEC